MNQAARPPRVASASGDFGWRDRACSRGRYTDTEGICRDGNLIAEVGTFARLDSGTASIFVRRRRTFAGIGAIFVLNGILGPMLSSANSGFAAPSEQRIDTSSCVDRDAVTGGLFSERTVLPASVQLCQTAAVSVTVRSRCNSVPMIIMLNMDISASMFGSPLDAAQRAASALVSSLDLDGNPDTQVGIVTHGREARTLLSPTNKRSLIIGRINSLRSESGDNLPRAIRVADLELSKSASRATQRPLEYMVIFSDGGQDARPEDSLGPARSASSRGVQIISMCAQTFYPPNCGALREIASETRLAFDVRDASRLALHFDSETTAARNVRLRSQSIVEHIPSDVDYRLASAWPSADYDPTARTLTFSPADPETGEFQLGYDVGPRVTGPIALSPIESRFVDTRGLTGSIEVPTTTLNVEICAPAPVAPSATPPPSSTPLPGGEATARPSTPATRVPTALRIHPSAYLPIAFFDCPSHRRPVDTVLVVDYVNVAGSATVFGVASSSAVDLAREFVSTMPPGDRASIYAVGPDAPLRLTGLSDDFAAIHAAIDRIRPQTSSRLDIALGAAVTELESSRSLLDRKPVIVVLSSGRNPDAPPGAIRDAAWRAQAAATVFTIGIGPGADAGLLILVAGRPSRYYDGANPDAIPAIHRATEEYRHCKSGGGGPPGDRPLEPLP